MILLLQPLLESVAFCESHFLDALLALKCGISMMDTFLLREMRANVMKSRNRTCFLQRVSTADVTRT